ncbi:MAG: hypothetical protein JNM95_13385 [Chitinophagaceae bacterium]|nr:hypothetical protein [Chitinophagaceae bacterium]
MKKLLLILVILFFHFGFLEWGSDKRQFIFQVEYEIILKALQSPSQILHPLIILPFAGMLLLLIAFFQKQPSKFLIYFGNGLMAVLMLFLLFIGCLTMNWKMIVCTLPFLFCSILLIMQFRKSNK